MKKLELRQIIKEEIRKVLKENAEIYPVKASSKTKQLYDNIAKELENLISELSNILKISKSDFKASFSGISENSSRDNNLYRDLVIQIKKSTDKWEKPWSRYVLRPDNNLFMQSISGNGVVISTSESKPYNLNNNLDNDDELLNIYKMSKKNNLRKLLLNFAKDITSKLSEEELKLIAPNTPIIVTGK